MRALSLLIVVLALSSCTGTRSSYQPRQADFLVINGKHWSAAYQQRAAEYRALCFQAYNIARLRLDQFLALPHSKPPAIITDIDETVLDNSPYAIQQARAGKDYDPVSWYAWTDLATADTLAGSLSFFKYAMEQKVEIFYITNRDERERESTLKNLQKYGFPQADNEHLLLRQGNSEKQTRRNEVAKSHTIIMLLGDNLSDFSMLFDKKSEQERWLNVLGYSSEFGNRFIIFPNASYGGWEDAWYMNKRNWTEQQKDSLINLNLKGYQNGPGL